MTMTTTHSEMILITILQIRLVMTIPMMRVTHLAMRLDQESQGQIQFKVTLAQEVVTDQKLQCHKYLSIKLPNMVSCWY